MSVIQEILTKLRSPTFLSSQRRADLEQSLYDVSPTDDKRTVRGGMPEYLRQRYDLPFYEVRGRQTLRLAGDAAMPLWAAIDAPEGMAVKTAVDILVAARKRARSRGSSLDVEVEDGIIAWEDRSVVCKGPKGRTYRRRVNPASGPSVHDALDQIRTYAMGYAERRASSLDAHTRRRVVNEMMAEVNAAIATLLSRLDREARRAAEEKAAPPVMRREVIEACELLHVSPPTPSRPLDMEAVGSSYKRLVKRYHPDVTGNESTRELFQRVVQARETLRRFHEETSNGQG